MKLAYKAVDKQGNNSEDVIEALSANEATEKLRLRGLYVTNITETDEDAPTTRRVKRGQSKGKALKNLALWSRQLCVLVRSGTPLAQAMEAIERQTSDGPWKEVLADVRQAVEEGTSLTDAMRRTPELFDDVACSLIAAGETSGQLGEMLDRVASLLRQQLKVRRALSGALVYPCLLVGVGVVVTLVMLLGVLPRFSDLFESMNATLPPTTAFLIFVSNMLKQYWWAALGGLAGSFVGMKLLFAGASGRRLRDGWLTRLPHIGPITRNLCTARLARLLGVMLESKVPLLETLELCRTSSSNVLYTDLVGDAVDAATRGESISGIFTRSYLITPSVAEALRHGERNGQIGPILSDMADFLDEENEVVVKTAMSVLEPLILIGLGLVVGFIALSMFIPLFDLTAAAGS